MAETTGTRRNDVSPDSDNPRHNGYWPNMSTTSQKKLTTFVVGCAIAFSFAFAIDFRVRRDGNSLNMKNGLSQSRVPHSGAASITLPHIARTDPGNASLSSLVQKDEIDWAAVHLPSFVSKDAASTLSSLSSSIFVLQLPAQFNDACLQESTCPHFLSAHSGDVAFRRWAALSPNGAITNDPLQASFVFVDALPSVCLRQCLMEGRFDDCSIRKRHDNWWKELNKHLEGAIEKMQSAKPLPLDRYFVASLAPHLGPKRHSCSFLEHASPFDHSKVRTLLSLSWLRVDGDKAINTHQVHVPYVIGDVFGLLESPTNASGMHVEKHRPHFLFVPASRPGGNGRPGDDERDWRARSAGLLNLPGVVGSPNRIQAADFNRFMEASVFCASVPGDTMGTSRLYKYMQSGCIPVVFVDSFRTLPFYAVLDWTAFSFPVSVGVLYSEAQMRQVVHILRGVTGKRLVEMQENLRKATRMMDWLAPFPAHPEHQTGPLNIFYLILAQLALTT
mmetsp:Transcript_19227/g.56648  ORF Transcript_19227/g.56648 Transcript_19227/m.56648 type:complete len:503 (-) Transcript_19227:208-1716(-)